MSVQHLLSATMIVCLLNGLFSSVHLLVRALYPLWMPAFLPVTQETVYYGATLIIAFSTLLISGVPAALYERLSRQGETTPASALVWLLAAVLLTLLGIGGF